MSDKDPKKKGAVRARHENSVLFTVDDLGKTIQSKPKGQDIYEDEHAEEVNESGFINLGNVARAANYARQGGDAKKPARPAGATPSAGKQTEGSGFIPLGQAGQALSSIPEPTPFQGGMIPMGTRDDNKAVKFAIIGALVLLVVALGVLAYIIATRDDSTTQIEVPAPNANPSPDAKPPADPAEEPAEDDKQAAAPDAGAAAVDAGGAPAADAGAPSDKAETPPSDPKKDAKPPADLAKKEGDAKDPEKPTDAPPADEKPPEPPKDAPPVDPAKKDKIDKILGEMDGNKDAAPADKLSRDDVKGTIQRYRADINKCGGEGRSGAVVVRFTVNPSGSVSGAAVVGEKVGTPEAGCVVSIVQKMKFPSFAGSAQAINYPFVLP